MRRWNLGFASVMGIGTGAALAASMGPAGYALGLGIWFGLLGIARWRRQSG